MILVLRLVVRATYVGEDDGGNGGESLMDFDDCNVSFVTER